MKEGTKGSSSRLQSILETMEGRGPNWGRHGLCNVDPYVILMALVKRTPIGPPPQGCISCGPCSCPELTEDHVLPSAYVKIFRIVTRNAVNKSF